MKRAYWVIAVLFAVSAMSAVAAPYVMIRGVADAIVSAVGTKAVMAASEAQSARESPTTAAQHSAANLATSTSTSSAHATEPDATLDHSTSFVVQFRVKNLDGTIAICLDVAPRLVAVTCATTCAAHTMVCAATAAATNGVYVAAGEIYTGAITGRDCLCVEAASGTPVINVEQVQRYPR